MRRRPEGRERVVERVERRVRDAIAVLDGEPQAAVGLHELQNMLDVGRGALGLRGGEVADEPVEV